MNIFSAISIIAFITYLFIGIYAYNLEKKSKINQLFMAFCISMAIWSFAYAFVYVTQEEQYIWMKISAIGWCTFSSFILHLVLLFTENRLIKYTAVKFLLYVPSIVFFYISVFLFRKDSLPSKFIQDFFYIGDFIYHFSFLLTGIILIAIWGIKSKSIRKRKQAIILVISSLTPFTLNLIFQDVLPAFGITLLPLMGHSLSLVLIVGIYYAMIKYRLFAMTPKLLLEELLQEMMDLVILLSPEGRIIKINSYAEMLMGYSAEEIYGKPLRMIIKSEHVEGIIIAGDNAAIHRLSEVDCTRKDGTIFPVSMSCSLVIDPTIKDVLGMIIVAQDISLVKQLENEIKEHKKAEEHILYLAYHDSLTGLPNRKYFYELLKQTITTANISGGIFAVFFLDMDDLKLVNDKLGHEAGDQLLCEVAKRAKESISERDIVARIGGDEFTFLISGVQTREEARKKVDQILSAVNQPVMICGEIVNISTSIGVSIFPFDGNEPEILVKRADKEMYTIKKSRKHPK